MEMFKAATGVAGGAPPAAVVIVYCWAAAPNASARKTTQARAQGAPPAPRDDFSQAWGRRSVFVVCLATDRNPKSDGLHHWCLRRSRAVPHLHNTGLLSRA